MQLLPLRQRRAPVHARRVGDLGRAPDRRGRRADLILATVGWVALLCMIVVVVVPGLSPSKVFLGSENLARNAPWGPELSVEGPTNYFIGDTIDSVAPTSILVSEEVRRGNLAEWDPYISGGAQSASLPNTGMLSPLSLPWWFLPATAANAGVKIMEVAAAALGMYLLLRRRWGLPCATVPVATMVFITSGFMLAWTNWPQTRVAALLPLLFWATDRLAVHSRWRDMVPMALVVASMLLGGFPAVTAYGIYTAVAYFLCRTIAVKQRWKERWAGLLRSALGCLLGLGLAAVQMLPFVYFSTHYVNFESRNYGGSTLPFLSLATVVVPDLLGTPQFEDFIWSINPVEGISYIGVAAMGLAAIGILLLRRDDAPQGVLFPITAITLVVGSAVYFGGPFGELIQLLPAMSTSLTGRMRSVLGLFLALLAALGMAALMRSPSPRQWVARLRVDLRCGGASRLGLFVRLAAVVLLVLPVARAVVAAHTEQAGQGNLAFASGVAKEAVVVAALSGAAMLLAWWSRRWLVRGPAVAAVIVLVAGPATNTAMSWWPISSSDTFYPVTVTHAYLDANLGEDRYASVGSAMQPGTSSAYRERSLGGHTFTSPQWHQLLHAVDDSYFLTQTYSSLSSENLVSSASNPILDRLGVRYLVAAPSEVLPGRLEDASQPVSTQVVVDDSASARTQTFTGPVRGVNLRVLGQSGLPEHPGRLTVRMIAEDGQVLAETSTVISGIDSNQWVALPDDAAAEDQRWHLEILLEETTASITLGVDESGNAVVSLTRPQDDGLEVVQTGESTVIERTTALSRVRWASASLVVEDPDERVVTMASSADLDDTVILEHSDDEQLVAPDSEAAVSVEDLSTDHQRITVTTTGAGWVVIDDPLRDAGWSATVDGEETELIEAEHVGGAIYISAAGTYTIDLAYSAPWRSAGLTITFVSTLVVVLICVGAVVGDKRHSNRGEAY